MGQGALPLLDALSRYPSYIVRGWVGWAAPRFFGRDAAPILQRLANDRNAETRDTARAELEDLGDEYVPALLPGLRLDLKKGKDIFGTGQFAMLFLARHRDQEAVPVLRTYAERFDRRRYGYRMPNVLADIEDSTSLARRIAAHDHDWMFWLVEAATILKAPGTEEALETALGMAVDTECETIVRNRPKIRESPKERF